MKPGHQALLGVFMAILSVIIIIGSFSLSMAELGLPLALIETYLPTSTNTRAPATYIPGQPTFTPTEVPTEIPFPTPVSCPPEEGWIPIMVEDGDTADTLAERYQLTVEELLEKNCLQVKTLPVGYYIYVPPILPTPSDTPTKTEKPPIIRPTGIGCVPSQPAGWILYTVKPGDTLYGLGRLTGVPYTLLQQVNCISDPYHLTAYTQIWVPYLPPPPTLRPTSTLVPTALPTKTPTLPPPATNTLVPTQTATNTSMPTDTPAGTALPTSTVVPPTNTPLPTATSDPYPYPYPGQSNSLVDFISRLLNSARRME